MKSHAFNTIFDNIQTISLPQGRDYFDKNYQNLAYVRKK